MVVRPFSFQIMLLFGKWINSLFRASLLDLLITGVELFLGLLRARWLGGDLKNRQLIKSKIT